MVCIRVIKFQRIVQSVRRVALFINRLEYTVLQKVVFLAINASLLWLIASHWLEDRAYFTPTSEENYKYSAKHS